MSLRRPQLPGPRGTRRLLVCGIAAAVVFVPSVASAAETSAAPDVVSKLAGIVPDPSTLTNSTGTSTSSSASSSAAVPTNIPTQAELEAQFNDLLEQLGITEECSTSVEGDITAIATDLLGALTGGLSADEADDAASDVTDALDPDSLSNLDPSDVQAVLDELQGEFEDFLNSSAGATLSADIQQLLTDLQACLPTAAPTTGAVATTSEAADTTDADETTAEATTEDATYLGYAPTGGDGSDGDGSPLGLLGAGTVLLAGGGLATRSVLRSRASR